MNDPAVHEPLARWLAYGHPVWMVASLALAIAALRVGLTLRRARTARRPAPRGARALHLRLAKPAVAAVAIGFLAGPLSVAWLRDWTPFSSFHGLLGGIAAVLFAGVAVQGRRLERGDASARRLHAGLGVASVALALAAAIAGFVLLP